MVADCFQCGSELDRCASSHGKLSSFFFFFCCLSCTFLCLGSRQDGWLTASFTSSGSPGHFYQTKMVCAKG